MENAAGYLEAHVQDQASRVPAEKQIRRAALTQAELAERMETTQSVVARLESGRIHPSTRTLERVARATGTRLRISFDPA